jgi:hypothetical protein
LRHVRRKPAAILHAVADYSRLMSADEEATLQALQAPRAVTDSFIAGYQGLIE